MLRRRRPLSNPSSRLSLDLTIHVAFISLFFCAILIALFRFLVIDAHDPYKCRALIEGGHWLDPINHIPRGPSPHYWQPTGCLLHRYVRKDILTCLDKRRIVLAGDSIMRQIYWAIARKLDAKVASETEITAVKHESMNFQSGNVEISFLWDPYLNTTELHDELHYYAERINYPNYHAINESYNPNIIVVGAGLWHAQDIGLATFQYFKNTVEDILSFMGPRRVNAPPLPSQSLSAPPLNKDILLMVPVQVPLYESLSASKKKLITPTMVDRMNDYLHQTASEHKIPVLWSYSAMNWERKDAYEADGLHNVQSVADTKADVILNLRCNAKFGHLGHYPFDRTCCSHYCRPNRVQWSILYSGLLLLPMLNMIAGQARNRLPLLPSTKILRALLVIGLATSYCFLADRTQLFDKIHKYFQAKEFKMMCWIVLILGILSLRRSSGKIFSRDSSASKRPDQPFLSREQTDEWKGWMQFMILIYHYTGGSTVLGIYEAIRLQVAAYLFMTGLGHTVFFFTKDEYSFRRFASVLIRLNLLSCLLPYIMGTDYLFYYFAPLVSFWFVVIYFTMRIGRSRNTSLMFFLTKLVVSAMITAALTRLPGMLEMLFSTLKVFCRIKWNVDEWRFRVSLDIYIVYVGMFAGILLVRINNALRGYEDHLLFTMIRKYFRLFHIASVFLSLVIVALFWLTVPNFPDKYVYNSWQPYISPSPVLAYMLIRNSNRRLRNIHSSVFAWLGRFSLETFTLQFHIWLAGDTKGLLSIGAFERGKNTGRLLDFVILSIVFLWVSYHVAAATGTLTSWIIDPRADREEVEIDLKISEPKLELPRTKSHEALHLKENQNQERQYTPWYMNRLFRVVRDDLRVRVLLLLGTMWVCNWLW